jgi:sec-independent protein translocase protein TatA
MAIGWQQLLIILVLVLVLFGGRGRISSLMGDMAKGIGAFKKGLKEEDEAKPTTRTAAVEHHETAPGTTVTAEDRAKTEPKA